MERTRRLRISNYMRDMVRENHVRIDELIYPIFVNRRRKYQTSCRIYARDFISIRWIVYQRKLTGSKKRGSKQF